mmetsp:Transcript_91537/g.144657  ORF Transcript_91537/g.144657 Transcript_91537/m.144657 type:complete len:249 (+) Transcript_91537:57-803(+)
MPQTVSEAVESRFSCRAFLPDKVPEESLIREILSKASWAASDGNMQPWRCYVLSGDARNAVVAAVQAAGSGQSEYHNYPDQASTSNVVYDDDNLNKKTTDRLAAFRKSVYSERRKECGNRLYKSINVPKEDLQGKLKQLAKNGDFFGAPVGLIVTIDRMFDRPAWGSTGMFLANVALLCEEAGLSTCFQGFFGVSHIAVKKALPQINAEEEIIWCGVAVGYADRDAAINKWRTDRAQVADFATFISKL